MRLQIGEYDLNCYEEEAAVEEKIVDIKLKKLSKKEFVNRYMLDKRMNDDTYINE